MAKEQKAGSATARINKDEGCSSPTQSRSPLASWRSAFEWIEGRRRTTGTGRTL